MMDRVLWPVSTLTRLARAAPSLLVLVACADQHADSRPASEACSDGAIEATHTERCTETRDSGRAIDPVREPDAADEYADAQGEGEPHSPLMDASPATVSRPKDAGADAMESTLDARAQGPDAAGPPDAPDGAIVGEVISWRLSCGGCGTLVAGHTQRNVRERFSVSCNRTSSGLHVLIEDPGYAGDSDSGIVGAERPAGSLEILNADPAHDVCNVVVRDAARYGDSPITHVGTCGVSCTLTGAFDVEGWDFSGTLMCNGLKLAGATGSGAQLNFSLVDATDSAPVKISVDGCDQTP